MRLPKLKPIQKIYTMKTIMSFGMGLLGIFIPVFLLEEGFDFQIVIIFLVVWHLTLLVSSFVVMRVARSVSLVSIMRWRIVVLAGLVWVVLSLSQNPSLGLALLAAGFGGIEAAMYWMPFHVLFTRTADSKSMGRALSYVQSFSKAFGLVRPLVAAWIAIALGFNWLFWIGFGIVALSMIPMRKFAETPVRVDFSWSKIRSLFKGNQQYFAAEIVENFVEETAYILLPIYVFLQLDSILSIAWIGTLTSVAGILLVLTVGKKTDQGHGRTLLLVGSGLSALFLVIFGLIPPTALMVYVFTVAISFCMKLHDIPYSQMFYLRAKKDDANFLVFREIPVVIGRMVMLGLALVFVDSLEWVFILAGIAMVYFVWFARKAA